MISAALFSLPLVLAAPAALATDTVALKAGTIHLVDGDEVLEGGTILIRDGRVVAVGLDVAIPGDARIVDYGPGAVIVPGFVAADSRYGFSPYAAERAAEPGLMAIDQFDGYSSYYPALTTGITSIYIAPARGRLIAGQGAVVKTGGEGSRVLAQSTGLHGSISDEARRTPGYWEPPIPATVDVGLGVVQPQLPRTTMGALVALDELLVLARGGVGEEEYGPYAGPVLAELIDAGASWRMGAVEPSEILALLEFFGRAGLPLVLDGAAGAGEVADAIAEAGVPVILSVPLSVGRAGRNAGKGEDDRWPEYDTASRLAAAGVEFAITTPATASVGDLRFAAAISMRGGLSEARALRAITLEPALILGVADRVGSIAAGKDADLVVLNGGPLGRATSVVATWIDGELAWSPHDAESAGGASGASSPPVVIEVEELHVGDGEVLSPGALLMQDGRIIEVGRFVSRPAGAMVVRGRAAMPGMIDALGHLGLEGSSKKFSARFDLSRILEPGDAVDRRVARAGVTTVLLSSRSSPGKGSPTIAYKPAGGDHERMIVANPSALRVEWSQKIRTASGEKVREALEKAAKYKDKWAEYEQKLAAWTPPPPEEDADEEEDEDEKDDEKEGDDEDDDGKKKKKKKKKKGEEEAARPVTGVWEGEVDGARLRFRLNDQDGAIEGNMRCAAFSEHLVELEGTREEQTIRVEGLGSRGVVSAELELSEDKLTGQVTVGGEATDVELTQTSTEYVVAARPERRKPETVSEPKGKPKSPGINPELEPWRQAMLGHGSVIVTVTRQDEILECVDEFAKYGIEPVLFNATEAYKVVDQIRDRIAGVILTHNVVTTSSRTGTQIRNRYAEIANAGIPIAFHSAAEEGAADIPIMALYAVSRGLGADDALRALTSDAARMLSIDDRVGRLARGLDADVLLLDGSPLDPATSILRVWVDGKEIR
ncbi:MAG: hypothetical protein E2O39_07085 [Planctomycetota bacterium]|nr:MAG: hypothetical protein E2O39_07085 [Planctomycetota bacterium]